jgi:hypothetical protein
MKEVTKARIELKFEVDVNEIRIITIRLSGNQHFYVLINNYFTSLYEFSRSESLEHLF